MKWLLGALTAAVLAVGCGGDGAADLPAVMDEETADAAASIEDAASLTPEPMPQERPASPAPQRAAAAAPTPQRAAEPSPPVPVYREVTLPAGTTLTLRLASAVASDASRVEDAVRATLHQAVVLENNTVLPAGTQVTGSVTEAEQSGRVRGRARLAFRFTGLDLQGEQYGIQTELVAYEADPTRGQDAARIGIGAGAGAAIGGLLGGGSGAARGAAIGAAAGTGAVLVTRGDEVRLEPGEEVVTRLEAPLTVRVRE